MLFRTIMRAACAVLVLFGQALAYAADADVPLRADTASVNLRDATRIFEDDTGLVGYALARRQQFVTPPGTAGEAINLGYRQGAVWLRFVLAPGVEAPADWRLEIAYPSLDHVEMYLPNANGVTHLAGGDLQEGDKPYPHHHLVFPIHLTPGVNQEVLLRVATSGNFTMPLRLWQPEALAHADRRDYARHALYFGALLALLLYNLMLYLSVRDPLYLLYVGMVAGMGIGQLSLNGFGNLWLWPDSPAWGNVALPWGFALSGLTGAMFTRRFLDTPRYVPRLDRIIQVTLALFAMLTFAGPVLPYVWLAIGVSLTGLVFSVLAVVVGVKTYLAGSPGARYFLFAWTLLLVGVGVMAARNMGWLPTTWWTLNLMQIGSALEMLLLSFALANRINIMQAEKVEAQGEAMRAKETMLDTLRRTEVELEARVRERTEALTEANEKLRASEEQMRQLATHDPLTGLANRKLLAQELDHALARARRAGNRIGVAFMDLNEFKEINDRHGHEVGDRVLVSVAERLCCQVRAGDVVARWGGDEFVLVLENIGSADDLQRRVQSIHDAMRFPLPLGEAAIQIAGSIGTSLYPDHAETAAELLRLADESMYRNKNR